MTDRSWMSTDTQAGSDAANVCLSATDRSGRAGQLLVRQRRLRGGLREGVDVVEIDNGRARFTVVPTRGMGVWRAEVAGIPIGWRSPVRGPVHPCFVPVSEPSGLGWLDGFDELVVRCGLVSNGAPDFDASGRLVYPLHGRIANRPAHCVEAHLDDEAGQITLRGQVDQSRLLAGSLRLTSTITTHLGEPGFSIHDRIENRSAVPADMQILYHVNFGPPLLEAGARLLAAVETVAPRDAVAACSAKPWNEYAGPTTGFAEEVYFFQLAGDTDRRTRVLLRNAAGTLGASLLFRHDQLPCFTQWKNTAGEDDGYVTGLEPATNFPNPRSFEASEHRVVTLEPGAGHDIDLQLIVHTTAEEVAAAEAAVAKLSGNRAPTVLNRPRPGWSPAADG